jgi:hypothetical protein
MLERSGLPRRNPERYKDSPSSLSHSTKLGSLLMVRFSSTLELASPKPIHKSREGEGLGLFTILDENVIVSSNPQDN